MASVFNALRNSAFLLIMVAGGHAEASGLDGVVYTDPFNRGNTIVITPSESSLIAGDLEIDAEFCSADNEYICFQSEYLSFAIPRKGSQEMSLWTVQGITYENRGFAKIKLAGHVYDAILVKTTNDSTVANFLFDYDFGLIAIEVLRKNTGVGRAYIVSSDTGYK